MAFCGTKEKCRACDKTVHFNEMVTADGVSYHKICFKCSQCNGRLVMSNYSSIEGVLYCKPHFEQHLKGTGNLTIGQAGKKPNGLARTPSKVSHMFSGTQEKCTACKKTVYPLEKVTVEGQSYHKLCFRCAHGGCFLTNSSYAALDGNFYCKHHYSQLFKEKGSYNHLTKATSMKKNVAVASPEDQKPGEEATKGEPNSELGTEAKSVAVDKA